MPQGKLHVTLNFLLSQRRLFTVIFHEAGEPDVGLADKVRDNLAQVLRRAGTAPAPTTTDASPSASPAPAPSAPSAPAPATVKPQSKPQQAKP